MDCLSSEDLKEERRKLTHPLRYADRIGLSTRWLATISGEKGKLEGWTNSTWAAQGSSLALAYKIGTSPAMAFPYICLTVCQRAITLLREDSAARLIGSLASSARYVRRRNPLCLLRRSVVPQSSCSKQSTLLYCTHNREQTFTRNRSSRLATCSGIKAYGTMRRVFCGPVNRDPGELLDSAAAQDYGCG
jgi:hypothetical protein